LAARKNPLSDKAYELYRSGMKLVDIATELDVPPGTVRRWKSTHNWDSERSEKTPKKKSERSESVSWVNIEHEYVTDIRKKPCTLEELAAKHNIAIGTIEKYSMQHEWSEKRKQYKENIQRKAIEKSSDADADRIVRLLQIADLAADKAEQALNELESYVVRDKKKVRTVEYKDNTAIGKPTKEVVDEKESVRTEIGPVDRLGLSQVTNALRNIKELYAMPVDMDRSKYQAEYERRRAEKEGGDTTEYESDGFMEALHGDVAATFKEDDAVET
jgi:phage terminase small subunit